MHDEEQKHILQELGRQMGCCTVAAQFGHWYKAAIQLTNCSSAVLWLALCTAQDKQNCFSVLVKGPAELFHGNSCLCIKKNTCGQCHATTFAQYRRSKSLVRSTFPSPPAICLSHCFCCIYLPSRTPIKSIFAFTVRFLPPLLQDF